MFGFVLGLIAPAVLVWKDQRWRMIVVWPVLSLVPMIFCFAMLGASAVEGVFTVTRVIELWPAKLLRALLWITGYGVAAMLPFGLLGALWSWNRRRRAASGVTINQLPSARARFEGMGS